MDDSRADALLAVGLPEIEAGARRIAGIAWPTPLLPASRDEGGLFVKLECLQRLGSFKIRGIWNRMSATTDAERARGFVTVSAGNAGQAVAWSARRMGAPCVVYVPEGAAAPKMESMRAMGAEVRARPHEELMEAMQSTGLRSEYAEGRTYVHPFGHPLVVAGHGSIGLEIVRDLPSVATVLVPVGGGGLSSGIATAVKALRPNARVLGVQAEGSAPVPLSFETGKPSRVESPRTFADGMKASRVFDYMWPLLSSRLDGAVRVAESELALAVRHLARECHVIVEGAGAAGLAAAWRLRGSVPEPIVAVVSGGNIDLALYARILAGETP